MKIKNNKYFEIKLEPPDNDYSVYEKRGEYIGLITKYDNHDYFVFNYLDVCDINKDELQELTNILKVLDEDNRKKIMNNFISSHNKLEMFAGIVNG